MNLISACVCGQAVDSFGQHDLSCRKSAGRFARHSALNEIMKQTLGSVNIPAILEPPGLSRSNGKRPDRMSLLIWQRTLSCVGFMLFYIFLIDFFSTKKKLKKGDGLGFDSICSFRCSDCKMAPGNTTLLVLFS